MVASVRYEKDKALTVNAMYAAYCLDILQQAHEADLRAQEEQRQLMEKQKEEELLVRYYGRDSRVEFLMRSGESFIDACRQVQQEEEEWERETLAWLRDPANRDSEIYSDVYKDFYGVRSRF